MCVHTCARDTGVKNRDTRRISLPLEPGEHGPSSLWKAFPPFPKAPSDVVSVLQPDGATEDKHFLGIWNSPRSAEPRDNAM